MPKQNSRPPKLSNNGWSGSRKHGPHPMLTQNARRPKLSNSGSKKSNSVRHKQPPTPRQNGRLRRLSNSGSPLSKRRRKASLPPQPPLLPRALRCLIQFQERPGVLGTVGRSLALAMNVRKSGSHLVAARRIAIDAANQARRGSRKRPGPPLPWEGGPGSQASFTRRLRASESAPV